MKLSMSQMGFSDAAMQRCLWWHCCAWLTSNFWSFASVARCMPVVPAWWRVVYVVAGYAYGCGSMWCMGWVPCGGHIGAYWCILVQHWLQWVPTDTPMRSPPDTPMRSQPDTDVRLNPTPMWDSAQHRCETQPNTDVTPAVTPMSRQH